MATLVYLALSGMAPAYLAADCQLVSDEVRRQLGSANSWTCVIRRTYSNYRDRCYAAAGPRLWNNLPGHVRQTGINFEQFKRLLRTFASYLLTYLLTYLLIHTLNGVGQGRLSSLSPWTKFPFNSR